MPQVATKQSLNALTATLDQNGKIIPFPSKPPSTNDYLAKAIALNQLALAMLAPETRVEQPDLSALLARMGYGDGHSW